MLGPRTCFAAQHGIHAEQILHDEDENGEEREPKRTKSEELTQAQTPASEQAFQAPAAPAEALHSIHRGFALGAPLGQAVELPARRRAGWPRQGDRTPCSGVEALALPVAAANLYDSMNCKMHALQKPIFEFL